MQVENSHSSVYFYDSSKYLVPELYVFGLQHEVVLSNLVIDVSLHLGDCQTRPE